MSVARVTTEGCPLSYSCRYPWYVLLPESKVIVLLWATAEGYDGGPFIEGHVDVCALYFHQTSCRDPLLVLKLKTM